VVTGPYRRVRNPIYVAVVALILARRRCSRNLRLAAYAAAIWLAFHLFVLVYEEPTLRRAFPDDYAPFTAAVPRWLPRLRPWRGGGLDLAARHGDRQPQAPCEIVAGRASRQRRVGHRRKGRRR